MAPLFARIEHALPGRIRVKVPALRGGDPGLRRVAEGLRGAAGILRVETRPLTGSLLLWHSLSAAAVADLLQANGLLLAGGPAVPPAAPPPAAQGAPAAAAMPALPPFELLLIALLVVAAGIQLYRGHVLEPASKLLWYALNIAQRLPPFGGE